MNDTANPSDSLLESRGRVRFAEFELDLSSFELSRNGQPVLLQPQPGRLLALLISRRGETVSRQEIKAHLWGSEVHVDHEQAINFAVRKIRIALEDHASTPQFVETVPRAGYRFLAPVQPLPRTRQWNTPPPSRGGATEPEDAHTSDGSRHRERVARSWILTTLWLALGLFALGLLAWWVSKEQRRDALDGKSLVELPGNLEPNAYELFLEGRHLVSNPGLGKVETGVAKLLEALKLEPDLAQAHLALAEGYLALGGGHKFESFMPRVESAARSAVNLEPNLWQAHLLLSKVLFFYRHRWSEAEAAVEEALRLNPNAAESLQLRGVMESTKGHHLRAMELVKRARELDPAAILVRSDLAYCRLYAGDLEGSLALAEANIELAPDNLANALLRGTILVLQEDPRAQDAMTSLVSLADFPSLEATLEWHIAAFELHREAGLRSQFSLALFQALAQQPTRALDHLRQACADDPDWELPFVRVDPRFAEVRRLSEFESLSSCFPPLFESPS